VTPGDGWVRSEVEDDYHWMQVLVRHDGGIATAIEATMPRYPWSTCPGAIAELERTFTHVPLTGFGQRGSKESNCTHLHDLAVLAAAHAADAKPLVYDILVSDPIDGERQAELRRADATVMSWVSRDLRIVEPAEVAGLGLFDMRSWIAGLDPVRREEARLLRWGNLIAHGRAMTIEQLSETTNKPLGRCYTFSEGTVLEARRIGEIKDFSRGSPRSLEKQQVVSARGS
jgi:hypothetical protein